MMVKQFKFHELVSNTPKIRGIPTNEYKDKGSYPVIDQGIKFIAGYSNNEHSLYKDTFPVVVFGDHTLSIKYLDFPFCVGADGTQILKPNTDIIIGRFLYYAIINLNIQSLGYSRHFKVLKKSNFNVPPIEEQHRIVKILDLSYALIEKRKQAISYLDDYVKAVFLDMFGDPVRNPKGWEKKPLYELGEIITGSTPPRDNPRYYSPGFIEWIKTDNIVSDNTYVTLATEYLSKSGLSRARFVNPNAILVACIAGSIESIGRAGITNRKVSFNQQINAIEPNSDMNSLFLYWQFKISKVYIQNHATNGMKRIITKGEFQRIKFIKPSFDTQIKFSLIVNSTELLKQKMQTQLKELENNFQVQLQRAFRGE